MIKDNVKLQTFELGELLDYEQPTKYIVKSSKYNDKNEIPVLTAGKTFILGYTNEMEGIFKESLPVIIFDDFTTAIKFVDFPFKVKSSAMKILLADKKKVNTKFLFYIMRGIIFPVKKHKRHWISEYSKIKIHLPNLAEQKRIAEKIDKLLAEIDKAIAQTKTALKNSDDLFKSELKKIFKKDVNPNWKVSKLKDVCEFFNGKAHEKDIAVDGKYIVINSKFISLNGSKIKRSNKAFFPLKKNDLVMVMSDVPNGKALAKCFVVDKDDIYTLNQRICALRSENFETKFLYYQLNRNRFYLSFNDGQKQTNLRKDDILGCPLFIPEISVQKNIIERLDKIKKQSEELTTKYKEQLNNFNKLKQSILKQAFQGEL